MRFVAIPRKLVILVALQIEARALESVVATARGVELHVIGMGAARLPRIDPESVVIVAGLAGALDPGLRVGDLVLDGVVGDLPSDRPIRVGTIHTSRRLISTPDEKAALFRETGAIAVDMEQGVARRALPQTVTVIGFRAISDPADMAIDPAVVRLVDDVGRPRPLAVATALVRRPALVPHLRELQANARRALASLTGAMPALLDILQRPHDDDATADAIGRTGTT